MIDGTVIRAHRPEAGAKGGQEKEGEGGGDVSHCITCFNLDT
ncbi:hypothetical protein [Candidatus Fukatsuia symbiotica]|nr:hypothetical protein [Candidatus Fukatsuia symbiotica]